MNPDELVAHSHEQAIESDRAVLQALVDAGAAGLPPGRDLAELAGLPERTTREALRRLTTCGRAKRDGKRRAWATGAGRGEAAAGASGLSLVPALNEAIGHFPAEPLRALIRLLLAAVIARWHLAGEYDSGWAGFISAGPTKTGKTSAGMFVCRVYGWAELEVIQSAFRHTPGSLIGRRERDAATGWRVERSSLLSLPMLCIDEWDKATREVQQAAGGLLLGATADLLEGERVELRPTVYVTLNTGVEGLRVLNAAHVRRSVVLDTTPLRPLLGDLEREVRRIRNGKVAVPRLHVEQLRPPAPALPDDLWELLHAELRDGLTDDGLEHSDVESLSRIALGRAALTDGSLERAVIETAFDYLLCADTLRQTRDGSISRLAHRLDPGGLVPDPDATQRQQQQLLEHRRHREIERTRDRDDLVEERGRLERMLDETIDELDLRGLKDCSPPQRVEAHGIAERLRGLRADVTSARSREALQAADSRARDSMRRAGVLVQQIKREREIRKQFKAATATVQRSRRPELAPARTAAELLRAMMPGAVGLELESLNHQAQQLEQSPPISEAERRKGIQRLAAKEVNVARMVNPYG